MRRSGVPSTNSVRGGRCAGKARTAGPASRVTDRRITVKENVAGLVSTTAVAVSVTRRRLPTSACPTRYAAAANGVAVVSAAAVQPRPGAGQRCQA